MRKRQKAGSWSLQKTMKKYKRDKCSPKTGDTLDFTCYTKTGLIKLKEIWNTRHPDSLIIGNDPKKIWKALRAKMGKTCDRESCWLKHKCIKENINKDVLSYTFAPDMPVEWKKKPNEWLTSIEITELMKQYEYAYKCFEFLGPSPIDFDSHKLFGECVWEELCKFSLQDEINKNKRKIGIIFNTDPHYKEGSHWVAIFVDVDKKAIYYFDSYGEKIEPQIYNLVKKIEQQSMKIGDKYEYKYNKIRHQYSDSECGMYCLYFIIKLLQGQSYKSLTEKKIPDKKMLALRKKWFN